MKLFTQNYKSRKSNFGKKGMSVGEIFVYSLSLVVVSMILIYGYTIINNFIGSSSDVEMLQFQRNVERLVQSYTSEYGSVGFREISAPGRVTRICFTDFWSEEDTLQACGLDSVNDQELIQLWKHPVIQNSFGISSDSREQRNLFLFNPQNEMVRSYYVGNVTLSTSAADHCNLLCINSWRGRFHIQAEGRGINVFIQDATPAAGTTP